MTNGESVCLSEREQKPLKWYRISHYRAWDHHHHLSLPPAFSPFEVEIVPTRELYSRQQFWLYLSFSLTHRALTSHSIPNGQHDMVVAFPGRHDA